MFTIQGRMPGLNEYTRANRTNAYKGHEMKREWQGEAQLSIIRQLRGRTAKTPVFIRYRFYEQNKKRDHDNVSGFAHKVIQDAMVSAGLLDNDGWDDIRGYEDLFFIDKNNPRIEVVVEENE